MDWSKGAPGEVLWAQSSPGFKENFELESLKQSQEIQLWTKQLISEYKNDHSVNSLF